MNPFTKIFLWYFCLFFTWQYTLADDSVFVKSNTIEYVVANATVCPVREDPSEAAEQATQLLFGEVCEVVERRPGWTKIRSTVDGQEGWVSFRMLSQGPRAFRESANSVGDPASATRLEGCEAVVATPLASATPKDGGERLLLTLGTRLPHYIDGTFSVLGEQYLIDSTCVNITTAQRSKSVADLQRSDLIRIAKSLLNTPYLWGGKNVMGMDCSGFTQVVYAAIGVNILRNAREQITQGELVPSLSEALPGDLAFFGHTDHDTQTKRITHVGLLLSPKEIIHCAGGRVHIDRIDVSGIYLPDGTMTHNLVQINRYL